MFHDVTKGSGVEYVAIATHVCFKCMFHMFQTYAANIYSKCFSCSIRMLQAFHLNVAMTIQVCLKSILHMLQQSDGCCRGDETLGRERNAAEDGGAVGDGAAARGRSATRQGEECALGGDGARRA
jgi:hypothetical protein